METSVEYNAVKKEFEEEIYIMRVDVFRSMSGNNPASVYDPKKDKHYKRSDAIEKMAKAMYAEVWKSKTPLIRVQNWEFGITKQIKKKYIKQAEAALDALLEKECTK